ncbi:conserved protein of unknown function (plasmid) [Rhodovastum atsumiense]|uniref:Uncharacterized protein n=1 Tax=Rhodovastum atsumiense TaxID=504468 RepID=A0A5M6IUA7_9PROT|nr:hypothetical protein [Rhodovastum atsumiense]KAA5611811.1 hypothetical protein F1189_12285 [Rhodovastum atsumiense]CAH2606080.1 conserved protein of unknown function [Rhodovastum atsumiense]
MSLDLLRTAGEAAFGADWQRPMARALGPLHPSGAKKELSDRLVRMWVAGDRPVPAWVAAALPALLEAEAAEHDRQAASLRKLAGKIRGKAS